MASRKRSSTQTADAPEGINPKAPCPCGSGRRYKHCHGSGYAPPVTRPFEGLPGEADWVALRELVPSATATLRTTEGREVTLASVLPGGTPALVRANGEILLGVQMQTSSDDVSRDIGTALAAALVAPAGAPFDPGPIGAAGSAGQRLQEQLDLTAPFEVTVHDDFGFWLEGADVGPAARAGLEQANEAILPTVRLAGLDAAYWVRPGTSGRTCAGCGRSRRRRSSMRSPGWRPPSSSPSARAPGTPGPSARSVSSSPCGTSRPTPRPRSGSPRRRSSRPVWSRPSR
jgi:hypothetical protein